MSSEPSSEPRLVEPYDIKFCFPIPDVLESDRVKVSPFIPSEHAVSFFTASSPHPELYTHLPFGPFATVSEFIEIFIDRRVRQDPTRCLFAIFDKSKHKAQTHTQTDNNSVHQTKGDLESPGMTGTLAGVVGFLNSSPANLTTEIGFVIILLPFQRTHVTSNAVGLLLHYTLDLPRSGGLGLRRVEWQTNAPNAASIRTAERIGFRKEAVARWEKVLSEGKEGNGRKERAGDPRAGCPGRDTVTLSLCWDDWEGGAREHADAVIERRK